MKAIDNSGLQTTSNIIVECISTNGIYCFGEKKLTQAVQNPFLESVSRQEEHTHFYLLVFTNENKTNAVADISDIIKIKTEGRYTVTLLMHKVTSVGYVSPHKMCFFHQVLTKCQKVYEHPTSPPNVTFDEVPKPNLDQIRSYWKNRNILADNFLTGQHQIDYFESSVVQESMMHIAVEQICLGLINVFLGYHPNHFSIAYLFEICEIFTPITSEIFPRTTAEDKRLFELLKVHPGTLRWLTLKPSCLVDTQLLSKKCKLFHEQACELIEAELERIENLYKKEL